MLKQIRGLLVRGNFIAEKLETEQFLVKTRLRVYPWQWVGSQPTGEDQKRY